MKNVQATADDDRSLIEAAQSDPARFVDLYDRYIDRVYAFVSRRALNRAVAEDITSQVFEQALEHLGRFDGAGFPAVPGFATIEQMIARAVRARRFQMNLALLFAVTALVLTSLGLYGAVSHTLKHRTREIALRIALGARPAEIRWMALMQALRPVAAGMAAAFALVLGLAPLLQGLLFGISPRDGRVFALTALVLGSVSVIAGYLPGRRVSQVNPIVAMRSE